MYRECHYLWGDGHPGPNDIPNDFADKVIGVLSAGIQACMVTGGGGRLPREEGETCANKSSLTIVVAHGN
jgi:hypothetical protein